LFTSFVRTILLFAHILLFALFFDALQVLDSASGFVRNGGIMTRTCILLCYEEIGDERVGTDDPADATVVRSLGWCVLACFTQ
jgi:hypothetical protein